MVRDVGAAPTVDPLGSGCRYVDAAVAARPAVVVVPIGAVDGHPFGRKVGDEPDPGQIIVVSAHAAGHTGGVHLLQHAVDALRRHHPRQS